MANDSSGFTAEEKAAMKARAAELKAQAKAANLREAGEAAVAEAISGLEGSDRALAQHIWDTVRSAAPHLVPKTYYGMPGWANDAGKIVCFFQPASKFKVRYGTFAFETVSTLDDGEMWPTAWAVLEWTPKVEAQITDLLRRGSGATR